ncbi:isopentenyl-diphosphate Delta-isomerase [Candidatus Woesearchaeota archaeon]|nr:isopentenyl-diphosphate Delta-isomerase [Candidatus Woesearchaeota archaeon]
MIEQVILVDKYDNEIGFEEKLKAHREGLLHRAFSTLVYNEKGEILLQQRAYSKYHSGGLWADTCSGHPRSGEITSQAAERRLKEETELECKLDFSFKFYYKVKFENGLTEHEIDHVYVGRTSKEPKINQNEVAAYEWTTLDKIYQDISEHPEKYAHWFKLIIPQIMESPMHLQ